VGGVSASEKLKALDAAASPGPWGVYEDVEMSGGEPYPVHRLTNNKGWLMSLDASDLAKPDAYLMAALRSALPQIVAVVSAAEQARLKLRHRDIVGTETWNAMESALDELNEALS
jgi:hypothetical protein